MFKSSKTVPDPSSFRAQTGLLKGWKLSAQQSKGVVAPAKEACCFLLKDARRRITDVGKTVLTYALKPELEE